jgi:hypothetical protein
MAIVMETKVDGVDKYSICIRPAGFPRGGAGHITLTDGPATIAWRSQRGEVWVSVGPHRRGTVWEDDVGAAYEVVVVE